MAIRNVFVFGIVLFVLIVCNLCELFDQIYIGNDSIFDESSYYSNATSNLFTNGSVIKYNERRSLVISISTVGAMAWMISSMIGVKSAADSYLTNRLAAIRIKNYLCNKDKRKTRIISRGSYAQDDNSLSATFISIIESTEASYSLFSNSNGFGLHRFQISDSNIGFDVYFEINRALGAINKLWIDVYDNFNNEKNTLEDRKNKFYSRNKNNARYANKLSPIYDYKWSDELGCLILVECTIGNAFYSDVICLVMPGLGGDHEYPGCIDCLKTTTKRTRNLLGFPKLDGTTADWWNLAAASVAAGTSALSSLEGNKGSNEHLTLFISNEYGLLDLIFMESTDEGGSASVPCQRIRAGTQEKCTFMQRSGSKGIGVAIRYRLSYFNKGFDIFVSVRRDKENWIGVRPFWDVTKQKTTFELFESYNNDYDRSVTSWDKELKIKDCLDGTETSKAFGSQIHYSMDCSRHTTADVVVEPIDIKDEVASRCDASFKTE